MSIDDSDSNHIHIDARTKPRLDWGPFCVGIVATVICYALMIGSIWACVHWSAWFLGSVIVFAIVGTLCAVSAFGVLYAKRRQWESARLVKLREGYERW